MSDSRSAIGAPPRAKSPKSKIPSPGRGAITAAFAIVLAAPVLPARMTAQQLAPLSATSSQPDGYWPGLAIGFGISLFAHESAHILSSLAMGFHPSVGLDRGRPTIFSGIDSREFPRKQFIFSAAGLTTQALIDELILDIPHSRGGAIERGILAGGIGTTLFYITLGRNGAVSDIAFMSRTSNLSKTQISLIFGGANAIHAFRIARNPAYDHFFFAPFPSGARLGLRF